MKESDGHRIDILALRNPSQPPQLVSDSQDPPDVIPCRSRTPWLGHPPYYWVLLWRPNLPCRIHQHNSP
ncbi:hypothetical protein VTN96DRAFT_4485 [Rasamsonia emersonii]